MVINLANSMELTLKHGPVLELFQFVANLLS